MHPGIRNLAKPAVAALDDVLYRLGDCVRALTDLLVHVRLADSLVTTVAVLAQHAFLGDATTPLGAAGAKLLSTVRPGRNTRQPSCCAAHTCTLLMHAVPRCPAVLALHLIP